MNRMPAEHFPNLCKRIGDLPQDVIENHSLIQKHAAVYHIGSVTHPESFIIATPYESEEITCYGTDLDEVVDSLWRIEKLKGFVLEASNKEAFVGRYAQRYGKELISANTRTYTLQSPSNHT